MVGIFNWKTGTPTEYGDYLVLHLDNNKREVIHHDVWFDNSCCWQNNWHDIIAWCKYSDIKTYVGYGTHQMCVTNLHTLVEKMKEERK